MKEFKIHSIRKIAKMDKGGRIILEDGIFTLLHDHPTICYGIIRGWHGTDKETFLLKGFEMTTPHGAYPYVRKSDDDGSGIVIQIHHEGDLGMKLQTHEMEMGAGYDVYLVETIIKKKKNKYYMYVANDETSEEMKDHFNIKDGDYLTFREEYSRVQEFDQWLNKKRAEEYEKHRSRRGSGRKASASRKHHETSGQNRKDS